MHPRKTTVIYGVVTNAFLHFTGPLRTWFIHSKKAPDVGLFVQGTRVPGKHLRDLGDLQCGLVLAVTANSVNALLSLVADTGYLVSLNIVGQYFSRN